MGVGRMLVARIEAKTLNTLRVEIGAFIDVLRVEVSTTAARTANFPLGVVLAALTPYRR